MLKFPRCWLLTSTNVAPNLRSLGRFNTFSLSALQISANVVARWSCTKPAVPDLFPAQKSGVCWDVTQKVQPPWMSSGNIAVKHGIVPMIHCPVHLHARIVDVWWYRNSCPINGAFRQNARPKSSIHPFISSNLPFEITHHPSFWVNSNDSLIGIVGP